ncbi:hypothetical protein [Streptomyces sp. cg36]|uniref:hypothetical protein n=1 Tax=Streptomyces sp. cg36 TaxID=3238798 RepID=UPI0034E2A56B
MPDEEMPTGESPDRTGDGERGGGSGPAGGAERADGAGGVPRAGGTGPAGGTERADSAGRADGTQPAGGGGRTDGTGHAGRAERTSGTERASGTERVSGTDRADLPQELRALGRRIRVPDVDGDSMAERVLAQLLAEHVPTPVAPPPGPAARLRRWVRRRWRALAAAVSGVLVVLALTPPVRAAVADWFGFGGVAARVGPSAPAGTRSPGGAPAPECGTEGTGPLSVREAAARAGFDPLLPSELGRPSAASVSTDGRVLTLCWHPEGARTVRIDEFRATLSPMFYKTTPVPWDQADVPGGSTGLWFGVPHELRMLLEAPDGRAYTSVVRTAGPTLVWQAHGEYTLRLEGVASKARAEEIAASTG